MSLLSWKLFDCLLLAVVYCVRYIDTLVVDDEDGDDDSGMLNNCCGVIRIATSGLFDEQTTQAVR